MPDNTVIPLVFYCIYKRKHAIVRKEAFRKERQTKITVQNQNQNSGVIFPSDGSVSTPSSVGYSDPVHSLASIPVPLQQNSAPVLPPKKTENLLVRLIKRADVLLALLLVLGSLGLVINAMLSSGQGQPSDNSATNQFDTTQIPLEELITEKGIDFGSQSVTINGALLVNDAFVLAPSQQPSSAVAGQMYYDQATNVLAYYNGTQFVPVSGSSAAVVQSAGAGLALSGTQISNTGVLSIQGQTGNVTLTAGSGIGINGTTISNTGVVNLISTNPTLVITNDNKGNYELTVNLGGAGVTSLNGLSGVLSLANASGAGSTVTIDNASTSAKGIAQFNPANFSTASGAVNTIQNIGTTATPTFSGVNTNNITPSAALTVGATGQQLTLQGNASTQLTAAGGGFTTAFGFAGVPVGNVTYNLDRSVTAGTYTLCSTVGNCAGSGSGVTSIGGGAANRLAKFTASQNIENSTITDNGTNVTTTADVIIQGGDLTVGVASAQTGTINLAHSGSAFLGSIVQGALTDNRSYLLPDANGTLCLSIGNCSGSGSTNTLQAAYDAGSTITTSDNRSITLTFADTNTDSNFLINLECDTACGANGRFAVQDDATDIVSIAPSAITVGSATTNVPITLSSGTGTINIGNGAQARTVNVGTGAAPQTVTLGSADTTSTTLIQGGTGNVTINSGGTIALQDTTTIAGNLTVTGTATSALTVKASTNGSSAIVADFQQSDNDSIMRLTDTGTLGIGNTTGIGGIVALSSGTAFTEIRATNVTAARILQAPDVSGTLCTDSGNCGSTTGTLQNAYTFSSGGTTPEIKLDTTRNGIEIQDANSTIGSSQNFLSLRGSNASGLGNIVVGFGIQGNLFMQPSTDRTDLVDINTNGGANLLTVDSVNSRVGIALGGSILPTVSLDVGGNTNLRGTNTGDSLTVSNASSTGAIAVFKDGATTVATIADGGTATFQNSTDSANAFRVLNAAGTGEHVGVDASNSVLRLLANNTGKLHGTASNWSTGTALPQARGAGAAVAVNGYLYHLGGCDTGGGKTATVYYSRANVDGSNGSWTATTSLPQAMCGGAATTYNGYIYVNGSATGGSTASRDIYYAKPNSDGTITSWTTQNDPTNYTIGLKDQAMAAYNGYLYITGGWTDDGLDTRNRTLYYGRINADGSVPSFSTQTNWLPDDDFNPGQGVVANGYLYIMGSANYNKFYYGRINNDGTVTAATLATGVTDFRKYAAIAVMNGYMYAIAGGTTPLTTIQYGAFGSNGDIASFTADTITLPDERWLNTKNAPVLNNFIYLIGGADSTDTAQTTVYYASGSKIRVGGGLDLTSYSGENMTDGGSGGQLTAGNTNVNGILSVTGNTLLKDGAVVGNILTVNGTAAVQTVTNSTIGFQVLNSSSTPQFVIDTTNSRAYIGNPTADSTGALLVLDTKNNAGDPTGVSGGMYYNSLFGTFRCYENGAWTECMGIPKPNTHRTTYMVANGSNATWTGYGDILTNTAPAGSGGSLSSNLVPSVYNDTAASIGSAAGVSGGLIYDDGDRLVYQTHLDTSDTSVRIWAGLTSTDLATMAASATPTAMYVAFRYDTGAGDSTWKCVTHNGTSSTVTNSSIAIADDQKFEIILEANTRATFKINGQIVCTVTTTIPNDPTLRVVNSITALNAAIKTIYVGWVYVQGDPTL